MKQILILAIMLSSSLFATNDEQRTQKQIQKELQKEKKYEKEQTFYQQKDYDFKGAEVNPDSLKSIPDIEPDDDFDMDDVY